MKQQSKKGKGLFVYDRNISILACLLMLSCINCQCEDTELRFRNTFCWADVLFLTRQEDYWIWALANRKCSVRPAERSDETFLNIDRRWLLAGRSVYLNAAATFDPVGRWDGEGSRCLSQHIESTHTYTHTHTLSGSVQGSWSETDTVMGATCNLWAQPAAQLIPAVCYSHACCDQSKTSMRVCCPPGHGSMWAEWNSNSFLSVSPLLLQRNNPLEVTLWVWLHSATSNNVRWNLEAAWTHSQCQADAHSLHVLLLYQVVWPP